MHGLYYDDLDNPNATVTLERSSFQTIDHIPERKRAINIIESKLNGSQWWGKILTILIFLTRQKMMYLQVLYYEWWTSAFKPVLIVQASV
jgi:hypothetical protein